MCPRSLRPSRSSAVVAPCSIQKWFRRSLVRSHRRTVLDELTPREREVLQLMAEGKTNSAIASALHISVGSAEKHIASIFTKLDFAPDESENRRVLAVLRFLES